MKKNFSKFGISLLLTFFLILFAFAQETTEELTITTYYPAPFGNFNEITTNVLNYNPLDGEPFACDAEHEGATYYDANENMLLYCNGTEWVPIAGESSIPKIFLGGYEMVGETDFVYSLGSGWQPINNAWTVITPDSRDGDEGANIINTGGASDGLEINVRNLPRGDYLFEWGGDIEVDQFAGSNPQAARLKLQRKVSDGWGNFDVSGDYYDDGDKAEKRSGFPVWPSPKCDETIAEDACSSHSINRAPIIYFKRFSDKDIWKKFRLRVYKAKSDNIMHLRVRNAYLKIWRLGDLAE